MTTTAKVSTKKVEPSFIDLFSKFYQMFFYSSADAIEQLAEVQTKYAQEYENIRDFSNDPHAIEDIIESLTPEKQAVLLKILFKAGVFGKQMSNLYDITVEEKRKLANDLRNFSDELVDEMKKENDTH